MTTEEIKRRSELYSALAEGKTIQVKNTDGEWADIQPVKLNYIPEELVFRVKPEPKYRTFLTQEECWNEMLKHQPLGWIRGNIKYYLISTLNDVGIWLSDKVSYTFRESIDNFTFADGTPFGIKDE